MTSMKASTTVADSLYDESSEKVTLTGVNEAAVTVYETGVPVEIMPQYWYSASTRLGQVSLGIYAEDNTENSTESRHVIELALIMQQYEELIRQVEDWLDITLGFLPASPVTSGQWLRLELTDKNSASRRVLFMLPTHALAEIRQPTEAIGQSYLMQWNSLPLMLQLSRVDLSSEQLDKLEPGGLYLITESFRPDWFSKGSLQGMPDLQYRIKIQDSHNMQILHRIDANDLAQKEGLEMQSNDGLSEVSLCLESPVAVPVDHLAQWSENDMTEIEDTLFNSQARLLLDKQVIASGQLVPVGNGYAVQIEQTSY